MRKHRAHYRQLLSLPAHQGVLRMPYGGVTRRKIALASALALTLGCAGTGLSALSPAAVAAPVTPHPPAALAAAQAADSHGSASGPKTCVDLVGDPIKGYGQYPLGLRAPNYGTAGYSDLPLAKPAISAALPRRVDLRDNTQGFNGQVEVALYQGSLYARLARGQKDMAQPWRVIPMPHCLQGELVSISINEDVLVGLDKNGWMYTLGNLLSDPSTWGWIRAWGGPFWFGDGLQSPTTRQGRWALSLIGNWTDRTYIDAAGKKQPVSLAKCTQVIALSDDGTHIYSLDPWLAQDYSYEVGTPHDSRFIVESLSASGSIIFVTNKYGDMYTRQSDYDINGADPAQFRYTWDKKDRRPAAKNALHHRVDPTTAPITLPPEDWAQQPKIPGEITNRLSIHSTAPGAQNRELRVEGRSQGRTGYWAKSLSATQWRFVPTDQPLKGRLLNNTAEDRSADTLTAPSPYSYGGQLTQNVRLAVRNFAYASVTRPVTITLGRAGSSTSPLRKYTLLLHTVDGRLGTPLSQRIQPGEGEFGARPEGLSSTVQRNYVAAFEVPQEVRAAAATDPELAHFLDTYLQGESVHQVFLRVTTTQMRIVTPVAGMALPGAPEVVLMSIR